MKRLFNLLCIFSLFLLNGTIVHSETLIKGVLKVGISPYYPPVAFKQDNKIIGIEADLARLMAKEMHLAVKFIETPREELESALNHSTIDVVMSGVSVNQKRQMKVDFTEPYMHIGQMVIVNADNIVTHTRQGAMKNPQRIIAVKKNTTGEDYVKKTFVDNKIIAYDTIAEAVKALKEGQVDYVVHDAPTVWQYTLLPGTQDLQLFGLYQPLTNEPLAWAVKKGNRKLLNELNQALKTLKERGLVSKVINTWIPITVKVGQ
jgi:ABC-type amino acid transport substrate-binding protein